MAFSAVFDVPQIPIADTNSSNSSDDGFGLNRSCNSCNSSVSDSKVSSAATLASSAQGLFWCHDAFGSSYFAAALSSASEFSWPNFLLVYFSISYSVGFLLGSEVLSAFQLSDFDISLICSSTNFLYSLTRNFSIISFLFSLSFRALSRSSYSSSFLPHQVYLCLSSLGIQADEENSSRITSQADKID